MLITLIKKIITGLLPRKFELKNSGLSNLCKDKTSWLLKTYSEHFALKALCYNPVTYKLPMARKYQTVSNESLYVFGLIYIAIQARLAEMCLLEFSAAKINFISDKLIALAQTQF